VRIRNSSDLAWLKSVVHREDIPCGAAGDIEKDFRLEVTDFIGLFRNAAGWEDEALWMRHDSR
jgi:hypothetical protein